MGFILAILIISFSIKFSFWSFSLVLFSLSFFFVSFLSLTFYLSETYSVEAAGGGIGDIATKKIEKMGSWKKELGL